MFKIFVGMETSGMSRRAFEALGCDVISCDTLPAEDGADNHIQGDVFKVLAMLRKQGWVPDAGLFHPTCTYHTLAAAWAFNDPDFDRYPGVGYHQRVTGGTLTGAERRAARAEAEAEVERIADLPFLKVIENPKGTLPTRTSLGWVNDILQPNEFGHDASKATCIWAFDENGDKLRSFVLPREHALRIPGRQVEFEKAMGRPRGSKDPAFIERWANQTDTGQNNLTPGDERWKDRSRTYPGIATALARAIVDRLADRGTKAGSRQLQTEDM